MKIALLTTDNREPARDYRTERPYFGTAPEALMQGFAALPDAEVHVLSCTQQPMKSPEKLAGNIYFHSLHVPKIGWARTAYQGCIRAVRRKLREIQPHIVHGQGTERDCAISAVFSGFPNVVTIHGNMAALARLFNARLGTYLWLAGLLENLTLPRTRGVFCNSAYTQSLVRPRNSRTWLVPNPLRLAFFKPLPEWKAKDRAQLINVGTITPNKRQLEILEVFTRLHHQGYDFQIRFVGQLDENNYGREFLKAIQVAEKAGYAFFLGTKPTDKLIALFDQVHGAVHFPQAEAFGLVVAEALSRNLKFFGASVGGIVDISSGVDQVELFAPDDWSGLEESLRKWLKDGWPCSREASSVIAEKYHPRQIAERHLEIYREVLDS
jgi:glycosyltransferase involved in cell wall biosynthesis